MSYQKIIRTMVGYHVASNRHLWHHLMENLTDEQFTQQLGYSHGSIRNQVVHLAVTDHYWMHDIQTKNVTGLDPQDFPTRESFAATWEGIEAALLEYVNSLADTDLEEVPDGLMETRWEALVHVVNHGTDHRAQILSMLHSLGVPTFGQDFAPYLHSQRWVSKEAVLKLVRFWYGKWEQVLESIPQERMGVPATDERSVKDILAHLTWYEREMAGMLKEGETAISELWGLPRKERNQSIYEQKRNQPLEQVLQEHQQIHEILIQEIERLEDEDLNDPSRSPKMLPDSKLWELLEENIWFHYMLHSEALWAWQEHT